MKKSKFLKSSKEMLSRSFNPSKCKTSLRLAASRLKLLRNKKEVQVKQIRREISVLLESGQDQTARIRVEHVIREEKMIAAFDLIGIYCELIVARLPIVESQKICPIDLKEAVTSVVFASPRCGDIPELVDIKKHFTEKYGKDFITAAIELRPECGVSRILVEKLSAVAPDIQTKVKILNEIAKEHNVKWEGESIEHEYTPASDLLTGPTTFVKPSEPSPDTKVPKSNQLHDSPLNFSQVDQTTQRLSSGQVSSVNTEFQHEVKPHGGEGAQLFRGDTRPRWNMDFKDATSAAQAAAESAEMASMAARAAAELSRRDSLTSQHSTESPSHSLRDGARDTYMRSNIVGEQFSKDSTNRSVSEHSRLQNELIDKAKNNSGGKFEGGRDGRKEYSRSSSSESKASVYDDIPAAFGYSRKNSINEVSSGEKSVQSQSFKRVIEKKDSSVYSHSSFSISNNADIFGKEGIYEEASEKSYHGSAAVFDKSDSESDHDGFDMSPTYDEPQQGSQLPLHAYRPTTTESSSSKTVKPSPSVFLTRKSSDFHEKSMDGSKMGDSVSVALDESDGRTSESEEEVQVSRDYLSERRQSAGLQFKDKSRPSFGSSLHRGSPQLSPSTDSEYEETDSVRNQGKKFGADPPEKFSNQSPEREEGLNFGKLTGGFRHKGYNYPSLGTNQLLKSTAKPDIQSTYIESSSEEEDTLRKRSGHYTLSGGKPSYPPSNLVFSSDSDSDADLPKEPLGRTHRLPSGISRRKKASPSDQEKEKLSKIQLRSEALDVQYATTPTGYETRSKLGYHSHVRKEQKPTNSYSQFTNDADLPTSSKMATKTTSGSLYQHNSPRIQESKVSTKSNAREQASLPHTKTEASTKQAETLSKKDSSKQKASHVHPKLPDYDDFLQFFQKNRP